MKRFNKGLRYAGITLFAVLFSWITHELAHWLVNTMLGYEAVMTLNTVYLKDGEYQQNWHWILTSAAGPVITILEAWLAYHWLYKKSWKPELYPFLLIALYTRLLAGFMNIFNLNDEGRISHYLGIGDFTISILVSALLMFWVYRVSADHKPGWKFQVFTLLLIMFFSSILILGDQAWKVVLLPFW